MEQMSFQDIPINAPTRTDLGNQLVLEKDTTIFTLLKREVIIKTVDRSDKTEFRIFVIEAMGLGAKQSALVQALSLSRQTLHNWRECHKYFGVEGLIHNYGTRKKSRKVARSDHSNKLKSGNTAEELRNLRKQEKEQNEQCTDQLQFEHKEIPATIEFADPLFNDQHDWKATRYAGSSIYLPTLFRKWHWLEMVLKQFGCDFKILVVFLFMSINNIRSIEQLKNVTKSEAADIVGLGSFPHEKRAREWFYSAAKRNKSDILLSDFTQIQVKEGLVHPWILFTDGHLLPYTGKDKVHYSFNTQRRQAVPGRTNMVTHDINGQVFDFEIQEGKGDLRGRIIELANKWRGILPENPVHVFDREGNGNGFFASLVDNEIEFVTWEKNANRQRLEKMEDSRFELAFKKNGKTYRVFEETKVIKLEEEEHERQIKLRRICLWNVSSNRRTCGLAWVPVDKMDIVDCAKAILSRWGASENTFKHMGGRHPMHYHPGFKKITSDKQDIANPAKKAGKNAVAKLKKALEKSKISFGGMKEAVNKDGMVRKNCPYSKTRAEIKTLEAEIKPLKETVKGLPDRVNVTDLEDYRSFKKIDNDGKNLFDFTTSSVWNARKWMVQTLAPYYEDDNEVVDLFYAISKCHGWTRVTEENVYFRLEPLQQKKRRMAQEYLCKRLTSLGYILPNGKRIIIGVDVSPLKS